MASFQPEFYNPATAPVIDRAGGFVVSGDRFNGVTLPGDAPTDDALAEFPQLANLQRLYHGVPNGFAETAEGRLPAASRDGLRPQRTDDVQGRHRPVPEPRADQHDGRLRLQCAALGDADGDQRQRGYAGRRVDAQLPARRRDRNRRTSPTRRRGRGTRRSIACCRGRCVARCRMSGARRRNLERARNINQLQPGTIQAQPGRERQRAPAVSRIRQHHALRDDRQVALQQPADAGRAAIARAASASASPTRSRGRGTTAAAAATSCRTRTTTAGSTASRISIARTCWCRRCAMRFPTLESSAAPLRWVLGNWDVSGIFQAQSGAPFGVTHARCDVAGVGAGQRHAVLRSVVGSDWP